VSEARLPVRKIREVLQLKAEGFSDREIAVSIRSARLSWRLLIETDEAALHEQLYRRAVPLSGTPHPDFAHLHRELLRSGVTRLLLWEEHKAVHPDGWQYRG
jgi:transposase